MALDDYGVDLYPDDDEPNDEQNERTDYPDPTDYEPPEADDERPPNVQKRKPVTLPGSSKRVGTLVWDHAREWNAYLTPRTVEKNLLRKYNAFPVSIPLLGRLQSYEVERVLVPVRDDEDYGHGTVYEFELDAYLPENAPVFEWDRENSTDAQTCPDKDDDSVHIWVELGSDLYHRP